MTEIDKEFMYGQTSKYFPNVCNLIVLDCSFGIVSNCAYGIET
jgi:hypothetical protein